LPFEKKKTKKDEFGEFREIKVFCHEFHAIGANHLSNRTLQEEL